MEHRRSERHRGLLNGDFRSRVGWKSDPEKHIDIMRIFGHISAWTQGVFCRAHFGAKPLNVSKLRSSHKLCAPRPGWRNDCTTYQGLKFTCGPDLLKRQSRTLRTQAVAGGVGEESVLKLDKQRDPF
jgi:hypothetical protein